MKRFSCIIISLILLCLQSVPASADDSNSLEGSGADAAAFARQYLGSPYCWGGEDPLTGFDCSGFVFYVFAQYGTTLNRTASGMTRDGVDVPMSALQEGDILLFSDGTEISHCGIYLGNGEFIHACNEDQGVIISELSSGGFRLQMARRVL